MGCTQSICHYNHTSFGRGDDEEVPHLEKLIASGCSAQVDDLHELRKFGETLQTGDILLMHCTHQFGKLAQMMTFNVWDHVAIVVRLDDTPDLTGSRIALITKSPQPPSKTLAWPLPGSAGYGHVEVFEAMGGGVFSYPFVEHAIARGAFNKYTCVRRLRNAKGEPIGPERRAKIHQLVQEFWARPYEDSGYKGMSELARPIVMGAPKMHRKANKNNEALDRLFCSELVAEAYQSAGLLPEENLNSNDVLPGHFAPGKSMDDYLKAQDHGFTLSEVEIFKGPSLKLSKVIVDRRAELQAKAPEEGDNIAVALNPIQEDPIKEMKPQ